MGRPKLLLPLGGRTVLEHLLAALSGGGGDDCVVVVGPEAAELAAVAAGAGANVLRLAEQTADMRATCLQGLEWLRRRHQPQDTDGFLLVPADHPTLAAEVVKALVDTAGREPALSIVVPAYQGRRGHPVWIRWRHVAEIGALAAGEGLNRLIRRLSGSTREIDWASAEILRDLDTPEDYDHLLGDWQRHQPRAPV